MKRILCVVGLLLLGGLVMAARPAVSPVPDLTKDGKKDNTPDWNLGPTGAKGWVFARGFDTSEARQILVTEVAQGSPAEGVLSADDVIIGTNGKAFESDPRRALGQAITEAEQDANKGLLKLVCWRKGEQKDVTIPLKVMGSYSETSPYTCPKAKLIVEQGCRVIMKRGLTADKGSLRPDQNWTPEIRSSLEALALLASGNPEYLEAVKEYAHKLAPPDMKWRLRGEHEGLDTWSWGYGNLFLTEYYLATKDEYVLPAIRELARKIAIGQSEVGTWGHGFLIPRNHGNLGGYGAINQPGLICWISLVLAQKCGIDDPDVQKAVAKSRKFFSFYTGKGSIPYGDHSPYRIQHDDNGKSGSAAVTFDLLGDTVSAQFFSRLATAAYGEKELGHTGNYFGFLWGALGANRAGPEAAAAYLKELRWYYELARRWDGSFFTTSRDNYDWDMTGIFVLHYALPLQKLYLTGKGVSQANFLTGKELRDVLECGQGFADGPVDRFYETKNNGQLLKALESWSPLVRQRAAKELAKRPEDVLSQLVSLLGGKDMNTRYGACLALQYLGKRAAPATDELIRQLSEKDMWLRTQAAYALSCIGQPADKAVPELLKLAAAVDDNDPRGRQSKYLSFALFTSFYVDMGQQNGLLGDSVKGVDRELLYPVIRRLLASDDGQTTTCLLSIFKTLSAGELKGLLPEILKVATNTPPSGEMFAHGIREEAFRFMARNQIPEGLPAIIQYAKTENGWGNKTKDILPFLKEYGPAARETLPQLKALQAAWKAEETAQNETKDTRSAVAAEVIKAIELVKTGP
jgi:hypothetical protein